MHDEMFEKTYYSIVIMGRCHDDDDGMQLAIIQ